MPDQAIPAVCDPIRLDLSSIPTRYAPRARTEALRLATALARPLGGSRHSGNRCRHIGRHFQSPTIDMERGYLSTRLISKLPARERRQMEAHASVNYLPHLPEDRSAPILDVGIGHGFFLDWLHQVGYREIRGIDVDPECVAANSPRHRVELVSGAGAWLRSSPGPSERS